MKKMDNLDTDESLHTEAVIAEARQKALKKLWIELLKTGFFMLAAVAVLVFGSIAWFIANKRVQAGSASIAAQQEIVRIASKGVRQTYEWSILSLPDGETYPYEEDTYYYTEGGEIALRLSEDYTVSPGARGSIEFYIIPIHDGAANVTLNLGMGGYAMKADETVDDPTLDALLSGHILLFEDYEEKSGNYSGWLSNGSESGILNNTITVTLPEETRAGVPFPVTLYWIWPLRYENMVNDLYAADSTEYESRFKPFIEAQSQNMNPISDSGYYYSRIFLTNKTPLTDTASRTKAYNLADEYIGTNADYLYLTIQTLGFADKTP